MLALRAVIFDYGKVLTGPPDPAAYAELLRITGLSRDQLDRFYWADRHAYDLGELTGLKFWRKIARDAGLALGESAIEELNLWDARMWTRGDPAMLKWQLEIKQRGLLTAIVSNMGDAVLAHMERELEWLNRFDVLVWSYQLRIAKPDPAIYRYALGKLGTRPAETLFIDDRQDNVDTATALGMKGLVFSTVEKLRVDLVGAGLDRELPLP
ncbi:MAG: HAD family phosphatase [Terracidiphilus sp.]|jgi:putative hydrolase of the HAD superfamily